MLLSVGVMFRHVLADRQAVESRDPAQRPELLFQRQVPVPALREHVSRRVDTEAAGYPAVDAQELDQHLGAVHAVDAARIDQLRNEGREPERDVETPVLELLDGRDTLRWRSCPLVSTGEGVVRGRHRNLDMGQSTVHYVNIAFPGHHGRFRYDQITDAALVQHAYRFVREPVDCLGGLETVRHAAHAYNRAGSKAGDGPGDLRRIGHGRTARVSQAPELQQRTCVTVGAVVHAAAAVRVEPRRIAALAALVPRHGLEKGFELFRFHVMSFHNSCPFS